MRPHRFASLTAAATAAAGCCLALPLTAHAAVTKTVYLGEPPSTTKHFNDQGGDVDAFFPTSITVHAGDKVRFVPAGFHTVDLPKRGSDMLPLFTPTQPITGSLDAAGNPFWFNGQTNLGFNPALLKPTFGKTLTYTGASEVESGLPTSDKVKPLTVRFAKSGTFMFHCNVHPGMMGTVHVVGRSKRLLSTKAEAARVTRQIQADLKILKGIDTKTAPANTVRVGAAGKAGVEYFDFIPNKLSVPVGATLTFAMPVGSREPHTATTGPGDPLKEPKSYIGALAGSLDPGPFDPAAIFPSDPPGAPQTVDPTSHGNGFWNSGVMDSLAQTTTLPPSSHVTFTAPGTYEFHCLIHPFMHATITVA